MIPPASPKPERVAKLMARAGLCSRREAERWIAEGRVALDGRVLDRPAVSVDDPRRLSVDGRPLPAAAPARLWRYHKPPGLMTTHRDPQGRPTVFERLPAELGRLIAVGRLDLTSEGLLLLTNDGGLARHLELPATGWTRRYRVRAFGPVDADRLAALAQGITIDGVAYGPVEAALRRPPPEVVRRAGRQGGNVWLDMALKEGRNREVRRLCAHLGLKVSRLIRVAYGAFQLGRLPRGAVAEVRPSVLADQVGGAWGRRGRPTDADRRR